MCRILLTAIIITVFAFGTNAQQTFDNWAQKAKDARVEPFVMMQLWSNYSMNHQVYDADNETYQTVDDRFNVLLRRARLGFRARPYADLKFTVVAAYDLLGRDVLTAMMGGTNNGKPAFAVWDAFFQWRIKKGSEVFNLVGGYFRPQLSRESITSGWSVNSMEKSMSQNYIRRHMVGTGPGRTLGLNLGGLLLSENQQLGLNYNLGIFNPLYHAYDGNSVGAQFSPLIVGRAVLYLGEPEQTQYKIGYDINYYNQRKGISIALGGSWQGQTDLFDESRAISADILLNYGPLNLDAEWNLMWRDGSRLRGEAIRAFTYQSNTGHIRAGYNLILGEKFFLEPTFMIMQFNGATDAVEQADAQAVGFFSGEDHTFDAGINWYLNKKHLKVMLHYTWHQGDPGDAGEGATVNQFFSQRGVGAIRRGNWIGLGVNAVF